MSEQPLVFYDFRNPEEAFELMGCGKKKGIVTEDFVIELTAFIQRLQEQLNEANEIILWHATTAGESNTDWCRDYVIKWGVK